MPSVSTQALIIHRLLPVKSALFVAIPGLRIRYGQGCLEPTGWSVLSESSKITPVHRNKSYNSGRKNDCSGRYLPIPVAMTEVELT